MNPRTIKSLSFALLGLLLFFAVVILFKIYSDKEVPAQFTGALLGAIVTAAITMALLHGQSQAEETKERNVKVFEEKTRRYNDFLSKLWKVWEDRHVSLEELNDLMETVSRDIIIYTKAENTQKLLKSLTGIADLAGQEAMTEQSKELVQGHVFDIINTLSDEIGLGGSITKEIRHDLNHLEGKIRPFLITKEFRQRLLDDVALALGQAADLADDEKGLTVSLSKPYYEEWAGNEYLWVKVGGGPVELGIGPVSNRTGTGGYSIGFFAEFYSHREFQKYRDAQRGFRKDFLSGIKWDIEMKKILPDFNHPKSVADWVRRYAVPGTESLGIQIGRMLVQFAQQWQHEERGIDSIIEECCPPKASTLSTPESQFP
jgi:hypothetical protein